ncbi:MAG: hypothetical protein ABL958_15030 [Bdellovibrionia bacterium]
MKISSLLFVSLLLIGPRAIAQDPPPIEEANGASNLNQSGVLTLGPGVEFGQSSQTFTLSVGGHSMFEVDGPKAGKVWRGGTIKFEGIRKDNVTEGYGAFVSFYGGGRRGGWLSGNFELGAGVVWKDSDRFGVVQAGYIFGEPVGFQLGVLTQAPVYTSVKPAWFTDLQIVVRWNFEMKRTEGRAFKAAQAE